MTCLACLLPLIAPAIYPAQSLMARLDEWRGNGFQKAAWAVAINPINPNIVYAGARRGVVKSTDAGASWKDTGLTHPTLSLVIDYTNPNTIYAGGSSDGFFFAPGGHALWKSTDGGTTWSHTGLIDWDISLLVMDPQSPATLYAGSLFRYQEEGSIILWKTTDGGRSWDNSREQPAGRPNAPGLSPYGWAIVPTAPQTIYAPGIIVRPSVGFEASLFKSTDGGTNWGRTGLIGLDVTTLAIDTSSPGTLYAGTVTSGMNDLTFRGLRKSTDAGESWFPINNGLSHLLGTPSSISSLVLDPLEPGVLYAATTDRGVYRSADGGASWSPFNRGLTDLHIHALAIDPTGNHLYATTDMGIFDHQFAAMPCAGPLSAKSQSFEPAGGRGSVNVIAGDGCVWTAVSYADWIEVPAATRNDGDGTISYLVNPNRSATARAGTVEIAERFFTVTQTGALLRIQDATVSGKNLLVTGEGFEPGAVILLNDEEQKTKSDDQNPHTKLSGRKTGKKVRPGDRLQVRNPDGSLSQEFTFTGS